MMTGPLRISVALLLGSSACTIGSTSDVDPDDDDLDDGGQVVDISKETATPPGWTKVGLGVAYLQVNAGKGILIAYGGYTAQLTYSADWATELVNAKLGAAGVGQIYAVQGPADAGYNGKEIQNSRLRRHLPTIDDGAAPIYVVAHSSGSYVAHELLGQMYRAQTFGALARMAYADLDGGGSGLNDDIVDSLRDITFVYARDPNLSSGYSQNHSSAVNLGAAYAPHATTFEVKVPNTGCNNGAGWCLHDVLITHKPHNHSTFDLSRDYTDFVGRPATTEYLDPLLAMP
jgi:hypothetical protein